MRRIVSSSAFRAVSRRASESWRMGASGAQRRGIAVTCNTRVPDGGARESIQRGHKHALRRLPCRGHLERFVGLVEGEAVGDHFVEWKSFLVRTEKLDGLLEMPRLARP